MSLLFTYLLKANLAFSIGFLAYVLLLRREARFTANRVTLLGIACLSMLVPFLPEAQEPIATVVLPPAAFGITRGTPTPAMHRMDLVIVVYLIGLALMLTWFLFRLVRALVLALRPNASEAFSFFGLIVLPKDLPAAERDVMLAHERVHVLRGHSFDVLLMELLAAISWPNLLWRWAIRELRLVHEHEADAIASRTHSDYAQFLVAHALGVPASTLTNSFRSHTLKTRITMLHRSLTPRKAGWRYALLLPVAVVALTATAWRTVQTPPTHVEAQRPMTTPEQMPAFPGGPEAMVKYMTDNVHYPGPLKANGPNMPEGMTVQLTGTQKILVEFVVSATGKVQDVKALKETGPFADEAVRAVKGMPDWTPGRDKGKAVPVKLVLPVVFQQG